MLTSASLGESLHDLFQLALALLALFGDAAHQVVVAFRIEVAQGEVFHLPLEAPHPQPVGQRRINFQRLGGDALLPVGRQMPQRPHVVEPVGQLDQDDPQVFRHGEEHFAQRLGLVLLFALEGDLGQFGDAVHQTDDFRSKGLFQLFPGDLGILEDVVEEARAIVVVSSSRSARILATS